MRWKVVLKKVPQFIPTLTHGVFLRRKDKDVLSKSDYFKKNIHFYADRYVHLFLNQLTTLIDEGDFLLQEAINRLRLPKEFMEPLLKLIIEFGDCAIRGRNILIERPHDFYEKLLDLACRLQTGIASISH